MALPARTKVEQQRYPRVISRKPETSLEKEYQRCLEVGIGIYCLREADLIPGFTMDQIVTQAVNLLSAYKMDVAYLRDNPENALMTLAIAQELLQQDDSAEREKLYLTFALAADNPYSTKDFNYSEAIRSNCTPEYSWKGKPLESHIAQVLPQERRIKRIDIPSELAKDEQQVHSSEENISDISLRAVLLPICEKLGIDPVMLKDIEVCYLPSSDNTLSRMGTLAMTEHLPNGKIKITLSADCDAHTLEHEGYHAFLGEEFPRGYNGLLFFGANEAGIEMLTQSPREYHPQRLVLEEIFNHGGSTQMFAQFFDGLRGDANARIDFMTELIEKYGLTAYLQLSLLDPGATHHVVHQAGKVNRIFRDPHHVQEFFAHPRVA